MSSEQITVTVVGPNTEATITSGTTINVTLGDVGPINWSEVAGKPTTFPPQAHSHAISDVTGLTAALAQKVELDPYGKVLASQLPSYVDDVLEFANLAALPATGETGKIYVTTGNGKIYRWSGTTYIEISAAPGSTDLVPEGTGNLYHTTARAAAAAPVQSVAGKTGAVSLVKADVGLGNVDNTTDASKPVSTAQAAADAAVASAAAADATSKANAAQAAAVQRANHTGTQAIATVDGLQTALDGKAASIHSHGNINTAGNLNSTVLDAIAVGGPVVFGATLGNIARGQFGSAAGQFCQGNDARLSDAREWSAATIDQAEAEAGTGTTRRAYTAQRVFQAVAAWWAGSAAATKLAGIATGATANQTDAHLLARANHTGTQTASTISDFAAAVVAAAPPTTDASLLTSGTLAAARIGSHASSHQTGGADAINPVIVTPASLSASQNDYAPGTADIIRLSSSTAVNITGLAAPAADGAIRLIINTNAAGGAAITLAHESTSSAAANRFRSVTTANVVLLPDGGSVTLTYSTAISRWRIL